MLPLIRQLVMATLEYEYWGVNALVISFFLSIALTLVTAWGLAQQHETLWRTRRAEAVSVFWLAYYAALQLAILIYGFSIHSAALVINGLLAFLYLPILCALWKFKGFTLFEKASALVLVTAIVAMAVLPFQAYFFLAFALGGLVSALMQPLEMWRKKSAQGLSIKLIGTLLIGNIVWFTYGIAVEDWVLILVNAVAFGIFGTTALLWKRYRNS